MGTTFTGAPNRTFVNTFSDFLYRLDDSGQPILSQPLNPVTTDANNPGFKDILPSVYIMTFADNAVSYALSPSAVNIDLGDNTANITHNGTFAIAALQHGGAAEGDVLIDVFEVTGSAFDDIIRGSDSFVYLNPGAGTPGSASGFVVDFNAGFPAAQDVPLDSFPFQGQVGVAVVNNPGNNVLNGGGGNDLLEGRGGADTLNGGDGLDIASYETSPGAVMVQLPGVGADTQTQSASGADATGDTFSSIEGLVGSRFNDTLTGNSLDNVLAGGIGSDVLDGKGGNDTVDYSNDHFFRSGDTAGQVVVHLGLNNAQGTGEEFTFVPQRFGPPLPFLISTDTLISIENVTGTDGNDTIVGNEKDNVLDGRGGNDVIDGGLGNDLIKGGDGTDTVSYASHDSLPLLVGEQDVISLNFGSNSGSYTRSEIVSLRPLQFQVVETDTLQRIENVSGSNHAETINGNDQDNILDGRGGNDVIDGGLGNDTIVGGAGIDTVSGLSHDGLAPLNNELDVFQLGLNGSDGFFTRGAGSSQIVETDTLRGIENVTGSNASEFIVGNELDNVLNGRGGNNEFVGGGGNDTLISGSGDDLYVFFANAQNGTANIGNDTISDSGGNDSIFIDANTLLDAQRVNNDLLLTLTGGTVRVLDQFGSHPVETLFIGSTPLTLATSMQGGIGSGIISGTDGNDEMDGGGGDDLLFGNSGNDRIIGGTGNDQLFGGAGNDVLNGGAGNDLLNGGPGNDRLSGGLGHDTFVFAPEVASAATLGGKPDQGANQDRIEDFTIGQDRIDLTAFHATFADMTADHKSSHQSGPVTVTTEGHDTVLNFADEGSVRIVGVTQLHASDFVF
jgi:Ca2+-binding RTX toxin-like protein